jgi:hypothetical protein
VAAADNTEPVERGKERWILLRTIELLARKLAAQNGVPEDCGWDETATISFAQATVEYEDPNATLTKYVWNKL